MANVDTSTSLVDSTGFSLGEVRYFLQDAPKIYLEVGTLTPHIRVSYNPRAVTQLS